MIEDLKKYKEKIKWQWALVVLFLVFLLLSAGALWLQTRPVDNFPINSLVEIPRGLTASEVADHLEERGVIKNSHIFYLIMIWRHDPSNIKAGTYSFSEPKSAFSVARLITAAAPPDTLVQLTFPEGFSVKDYAVLIEKTLPEFNTEEFKSLATPNEGFLFPDTYSVPVDYSPSELNALLQETYQSKVSNLKDEMNEHPLGEYGVVTLASVIEREANSPESMQLVADVLLKRLSEGMRLQVDASLEYVLNKPLSELESDDLKLDSPYNTYLYDGLPPTPIGNPGIQTIKSVLYPEENDYYYYITDENGDFYYAKTFEEHKRNIETYLR